ncbi:MAG: hypothetical protein ABIJ91_05035 [Candidatus Kuenenbacteria bacterium]
MLPGICQAAEYYVSPTGSGTTCSSASPCSLTTGLGKLVAGDTLFLKDGTYSQSLYLTTSGTSGAYITIKALNDGQATINVIGGATPACYLYGVHYINFEGIICQGMGPAWGHTLSISANSSYVNVRRASVYYIGEETVSDITLSGGDHILIEDCIIKPSTLGSVLNLYETQNSTIRRVAIIIDKPNTTQRAITLYGADNCTIENNVVLNKDNLSTTMGIGIWAYWYNETADNNSFYGNIVHNMNSWGYIVASSNNLITGNKYFNNVAIGNKYGFYQRADENLTVNNLTVTGTTNQDFIQGQDSVEKDGDWGMVGVVKNSSFLSGSVGITKSGGDPEGTTITSTYNNFYDTTAYSGTVLDKIGDKTLNPVYDTTTYGKGAYLMVPSDLKGKGEGGSNIGAEVLYKYVNGIKTSEPLWPWPMEQRICDETGYSITYENGCANGGGLWKTLDGVYSDITPPAAPSGLTVQ